jgi:hypothetical protein
MAALNDIVIQQKNSATPNAVPTTTEVAPGELAVNYADGVIFSKTPQDVIVNVLGTVVADGGYVTN